MNTFWEKFTSKKHLKTQNGKTANFRYIFNKFIILDKITNRFQKEKIRDFVLRPNDNHFFAIRGV